MFCQQWRIREDGDNHIGGPLGGSFLDPFETTYWLVITSNVYRDLDLRYERRIHGEGCQSG